MLTKNTDAGSDNFPQTISTCKKKFSASTQQLSSRDPLSVWGSGSPSELLQTIAEFFIGSSSVVFSSYSRTPQESTLSVSISSRHPPYHVANLPLRLLLTHDLQINRHRRHLNLTPHNRHLRRHQNPRCPYLALHPCRQDGPSQPPHHRRRRWLCLHVVHRCLHQNRKPEQEFRERSHYRRTCFDRHPIFGWHQCHVLLLPLDMLLLPNLERYSMGFELRDVRSERENTGASFCCCQQL
jgi:hypothetical protein